MSSNQFHPDVDTSMKVGNALEQERPASGSSSSKATVVQKPDPAPSVESGSTDNGQKRINVTLTPQQYAILRKLADVQGVNVSDVLRQAINITDLIVDANRNGKILIEHNGELQRLKLV